MEINDFYIHPTLLEAYGRSRITHVIQHLRNVWPGFPRHHTPVNQYYAAWILSILAQCRTTKREDVVRAIKRIKELKCDGEAFIPWFGGILENPEKAITIKNIFFFYEGDNCVQVTPAVDRGNTITKIFQGKTTASHIRSAAILDQQFLLEISKLIHEEVQQEEIENLNSDIILE